MKKLSITCVAACVLSAGLSTSALAQDVATKKGKLFTQLDRNSDGSISADEIGDAQKKSFQRLLRVGDKDKNGELTRAEYTDALKPLAPVAGNQRNSGRRPGGTSQFNARQFFQRLDRDKNGKLTLEELPEQLRGRFKPLFDRLKKDEVTLEEFARASRGGQANRDQNPEEMFKRFDRNNDGKLTKAELPESLQNRFRFLFGRLKKEEVTREEFIEAVRRASDPAAIFRRFDSNKDGKLTLTELPESLRPRLRPLFERSGKEALTREEFVRGFPRRPATGRPPMTKRRESNRKRSESSK